MAEAFESIVKILPETWPDKPLDLLPGDLSCFAPIGLGLPAPMILRPWDNLEDLIDRPNFYGGQARSHDPFQDAPLNDAAAGTVYFGGSPRVEDVDALLRLLRVIVSEVNYAAFCKSADDPQQERYLTQLRIVCRSGLSSLFGVSGEDISESVPSQPLSVGELVRTFISHQEETWGSGMSRQLRGVMGGDGDWAKEALAFGFMVENGYHGVYRIWSRAWLVTK